MGGPAAAGEFPRYLHQPYRFLWFEKDEVYIMVGVYILSLAFSLKLLLLIPAAVYLYRREKRKWPRGFLRHAGYRLGVFSFPGYPGGLAEKFFE